ncbi:uncharacterized protein A1O9_12900 [Exophiala aquamarina CBS 119918]|uniref:Uncharacterized protein n=1 Tax=Exophiala aquamarina CBS 119918 TaxID=1182545 RepID=A0A072P603_9EURO|nr:uncharacterized protein A1O9_12900 [Exophiala aquamarina CBS 119918]KEF51050.1 hypothetical protein A1O9_12900 [Exophiala aquamarina CBS 119918]
MLLLQLTGLKVFALPEWKGLPTLLRCYAKAGWFEGSVFFAITSLYTYQLSQIPPSQWTSIDRTISTLTWLLYWGASAWYVRNGDKGTGAVTAVAGALQAACLTL